MASISQLLSRPTSTTFSALSSSNSSSTSPCPFITKTNNLSLTKTTKHNKVPSIYCTTSKNPNESPSNPSKEPLPKLDRREVLLGLGGLSAAAAFSSQAPEKANADPFPLPDLAKCQQTILTTKSPRPPTNCCPPFIGDATDFQFPDKSLPLRIRPAAHLVNSAYVTKFKKAIELMRKLPCSDPRNFMEQSKVHCAYCEGSLVQADGTQLQVHFSSLFFPWHRYYLYFFERIMGNLVDDSTFAMPFWNYDGTKEGMLLPKMYTDTNSSLYDKLRNPNHQPPKVIDLNFAGTDDSIPDDQRIKENLATMYRQVIDNGKTAAQFLGNPYKAGASGPGSIEVTPHNKVHAWTGDPAQPNRENMGKFYSAARDPIFYAHHANIDRFWSIWTQLGGQNFTDDDWLNAAFLFYDENAKLQKVVVKDSVDTTKFRYTYQDVPIDWLTTPPTVTRLARTKRSLQDVPMTELSQYPITLSSVVYTTVSRPAEALADGVDNEVLLLKDIEVAADTAVTFDVFINTPEHEQIRPSGREFAGSFSTLPHHHSIKTDFRLAITELLKDLEADKDESIVVTLVPREGVGSVKIGGLSVEVIN